MDVSKAGDSVLVVKWKSLSITAVIAAIPVGLGLNAAYKDYHTDHVVRTVTPIIAKHTNDVEGRIDTAQHTVNETQRAVKDLQEQVASLQVSAAIAAVAALQTELDRHERNSENSESWRRERDRLKRQIEQAKEYRHCLIEQRRNCDLLRGW